MLNLVTNACDAMPNPGEVTITVRPVPGDEARQLGSRLVESQQALLEVADTGTGVVPELRTRIFEPFFTTKQRGKGTGLGLAAVQGIVVQNKGSLALDSELGKGSRFRIFFAVAAAAEEPALASVPPSFGKASKPDSAGPGLPMASKHRASPRTAPASPGKKTRCRS